jgi:hypothetical protein
MEYTEFCWYEIQISALKWTNCRPEILEVGLMLNLFGLRP